MVDVNAIIQVSDKDNEDSFFSFRSFLFLFFFSFLFLSCFVVDADVMPNSGQVL